MRGAIQSFLLFIVGVFVVLILLSTALGKGIAYTVFGYVAETEPSYLQEELRSLLTLASFTPGEFEVKVDLAFQHDITIDDDPYPTVFVETPAQYQFSTTSAPLPFLTNCEILKECTKVCGFIGDPCSSHTDCCGELSCQYGISCVSLYCGNNMVDPGEECDGTDDSACPGECQDNCKCPEGYSNEGENCANDSDCWGPLECVSKVSFDKTGGTLVIKKFFENGICKIKIRKG
jgi:hypothetical protein